MHAGKQQIMKTNKQLSEHYLIQRKKPLSINNFVLKRILD